MILAKVYNLGLHCYTESHEQFCAVWVGDMSKDIRFIVPTSNSKMVPGADKLSFMIKHVTGYYDKTTPPASNRNCNSALEK